MHLSGGVCFENNLSDNDSSFVPRYGEKAEGGVGNGNEDITSDEEEVVNDDEDSDDEEEVGNYDE